MRSNAAPLLSQLPSASSSASGLDLVVSPGSSCNAPSTPLTTPSHVQRSKSLGGVTAASSRLHGPSVSAAKASNDESRTQPVPKLSKFLDASVQQPNGTLALQGQGQGQSQGSSSSVQVASYPPTRLRSESAQSPRLSMISPRASDENVLQMAVEGIQETMSDQMQRLSVALDNSLADIASRIDTVESRWSRSIEVERQSREKQVYDVQRLVEEHRFQSSKSLSAPMPSKSNNATLRAEIEAGVEAIAARKAEAISTIELLLRDNLAKQQEAQTNKSVVSNTLQQTLEGQFQEIMEMQIQKLTMVLSSSVDKRFADVAGKLQVLESKWAESIERERTERKDSCAAALRSLEDSSVLSDRMETHEAHLAGIAKKTMADVDVKLIEMRKELTKHKDDLRNTIVTLRAGLNECRQAQQAIKDDQQRSREASQPRALPGQMALQPSGPYVDLAAKQQSQQNAIHYTQQQIQELRQILDAQLLKDQTACCAQQPEMTPQIPTPNEFGSASVLLEIRQDLQKVEKQIQTCREDVDEIKRQRLGEGSLLEKLQCKVRDCVAELAKSLRDFQVQWSKEAFDARNFTMKEINAVRIEVKALSGELNTVQTGVVQRVGEVCAATLQQWKGDRREDRPDVGELEKKFFAIQEALAKYSDDIERCTHKLSSEIHNEREERMKSVLQVKRDVHTQLLQLKSASR